VAILISDLDGVIWHRKKLAHPHIPSVIEGLRKDGHKIYFLTNNSTRNRYGYRKKLAGLGIKTHLDEIICSADAIRIYLEKKFERQSAKGKTKRRKPRIFVIGEKPLKKEIEKLPAEIVKLEDKGKVDYVVVGIDLHFNYKKLARAMSAILGGAEFLATNSDRTLPVKLKKAVPGCGALLAAVQTATNRKPYIIGKPNPFIVKSAVDKYRLDHKDIYVIGDRLDTDIVLANRLKFHSVLVLSGAATKEMAKKARGLKKPEYVIGNITEIRKILIRPEKQRRSLKLKAQKQKNFVTRDFSKTRQS
jgi:HAD superfamily hydrolase (TIGR01450 family)